MRLRVGLLVVLALAACRYEASFKRVDMHGVAYDSVFESCHKVILRYYNGIVVRSDREAGRIETDPVEFSTENGPRRETVYVKVEERADGAVQVELFAPMSELVVDPGADNPLQWQVLGSDATQEQRLLDEVIGEVIRRFPDAVVSAPDD